MKNRKRVFNLSATCLSSSTLTSYWQWGISRYEWETKNPESFLAIPVWKFVLSYFSFGDASGCLLYNFKFLMIDTLFWAACELLNSLSRMNCASKILVFLKC